MNLQELKDEYAVKYNFEDWDSFINYISNHEVETHMDKICILAQKKCLENAWNVFLNNDTGETLEKELIKSESNILK